jgi:hypothetical protein
MEILTGVLFFICFVLTVLVCMDGLRSLSDIIRDIVLEVIPTIYAGAIIICVLVLIREVIWWAFY